MAEKNQRADGVLGDFSLSQLLATALAAATSFALSTQIGVAGSIIGAVVGAVASAVATQVYRNILRSSAEKIRALGSDAADETRVVGSVSGRAQVEEVAPSGTPIAPAEVRDAARERRQALVRRRVALAATAAGVVAVLAYALVVSLATQGGGIGTKPQLAEPVVEEQAPEVPTGPVSDEPDAEPDEGNAAQDGPADDAATTPTPSEPDGDEPAPSPDGDTTGSQNGTGAGTDTGEVGSGEADQLPDEGTSPSKPESTGDGAETPAR